MAIAYYSNRNDEPVSVGLRCSVGVDIHTFGRCIDLVADETGDLVITEILSVCPHDGDRVRVAYRKEEA